MSWRNLNMDIVHVSTTQIHLKSRGIYLIEILTGKTLATPTPNIGFKNVSWNGLRSHDTRGASMLLVFGGKQPQPTFLPSAECSTSDSRRRSPGFYDRFGQESRTQRRRDWLENDYVSIVLTDAQAYSPFAERMDRNIFVKCHKICNAWHWESKAPFRFEMWRAWDLYSVYDCTSS